MHLFIQVNRFSGGNLTSLPTAILYEASPANGAAGVSGPEKGLGLTLSASAGPRR